MRTQPWLFIPSMSMIAIVAHPFCIVLLILMAAFVYFFAKLLEINYFRLGTFFELFSSSFSSLSALTSGCLEEHRSSFFSKFYSFFSRNLMFRCMYWLISCWVASPSGADTEEGRLDRVELGRTTLGCCCLGSVELNSVDSGLEVEH